jgi:dTDP-4-dehydrorhamnose 3,5-epimerase
LSQDNNKSVLIPEGFAHGFSVLSEKASVLYLQSKDYSEVHDKGINPLSLDIDWGLEDYIISKKDEMLPSITEFDSPW